MLCSSKNTAMALIRQGMFLLSVKILLDPMYEHMDACFVMMWLNVVVFYFILSLKMVMLVLLSLELLCMVIAKGIYHFIALFVCP